MPAKAKEAMVDHFGKFSGLEAKYGLSIRSNEEEVIAGLQLLCLHGTAPVHKHHAFEMSGALSLYEL